MKQTIKYLILALLIPAAYCFTACDTDIEPIDQQIIKPDQQDPAQYAAYLAALKAYKASEHYVVYASLANAPAVPGSEKAFLRSLPDSLDIVALENAGNLTEYDIEDIPQAQAKGTKILYTVDYNTLAESTDAAALGTYLDKVIEVDTTQEDELVGDAPKKDEAEEKTEDAPEEKEEERKPLNDTNPLWMRNPKDCTDEQYIDFYQHVFLDFKKPLFWIHLNMDYPFNLKGILYFPKINTQYDQLEGTIKLYNNQVFIADNIKEVIPEFLLLLKGVIDCPDLPLNVSRSALQNDGFVKKISDYITKKVADKLTGMYKNNKEDYEKYWDDLSPFIKFGCLKDEKFCDKMTDYMLFKDINGKYITLPEYLEEGKEKYENKVFYISDEVAQSQYINMFKEEGMNAVYLTHNIDNPYITHLEGKNENVKFLRIDADLADNFVGEKLTEEQTKEYTDKLSEAFKKATGNDKLVVKVESMKNENVSSVLTVSEESRRMMEMMRVYNMGGMDPAMFGAGEAETLVLNANNKLVKYILDNPEGEYKDMICNQLYDLAVLANKPLSAEKMTAFVKRSNDLLGLLI